MVHAKEALLGKRMIQGCLTGTVLALILAILRRTTTLINRSYWNMWILSVAFITGLLFIIFFWRAGKKRLSKQGAGVFGTVSFLLMGALFFYTLPTLFLYLTEFVLPGESIFSTEFLFKFIGFALGIGIVLLAGIGVFKAGIALPSRFTASLLILSLILVLLDHGAAVIQVLLARRIIPMIRWLFKIVVAAAGYKTVLLYLLIGMSLLMAVVLCLRSLRPQGVYRNPAELRKIRAAMHKRRRWSGVISVLALGSVFILTGLKAYTRREVVLSPAEPMTIAGVEILIPLEQVQDGHLHRFAYITKENTEVRFIVIKKNASAYGVGLDACDICGATGYYERKDEVICRLCDVVMNKSTIGFKGGCNPVPLAYTTQGGKLVIALTHLEAEAHRFK
jgi:uncharacterized membrane protein